MGGRFAYFDSLCQNMNPYESCDELNPELEGSIANISIKLIQIVTALMLLTF